MKSIIQTEKECWLCRELYNLHNTRNLQDHHIFFGTANRKQSEKYGMKVWLCMEHHTGDYSIHRNRHLDLYLKEKAQTHFEAHCGSREEFREIFGKSWL